MSGTLRPVATIARRSLDRMLVRVAPVNRRALLGQLGRSS
jgi:hypothetical protein